GGILEPDLLVGLVEALEHGFVAIAGVTTEDGLTPGGAAAPSAGGTVGMRPELIARAVEADLLPAQRRRHHSALAAGLGSRPGSRGRHQLVAQEAGHARSAW